MEVGYETEVVLVSFNRPRPGEVTQVGEEDCTIATLRGSGFSNLLPA
jgi:hypothetical protein